MLRSRGPGSGPLLPQTLRGTLGNWFLRAQEDHIPTVAESSPAALLRLRRSGPLPRLSA